MTNLFYNLKFVSLYPLLPVSSVPPHLGNQQSILYVYESISVLFVYLFGFKIPHKKEPYGIYLSLTSFSIITSRSIHVVINDKILFFFRAE